MFDVLAYINQMNSLSVDLCRYTTVLEEFTLAEINKTKVFINLTK